MVWISAAAALVPATLVLRVHFEREKRDEEGPRWTEEAVLAMEGVVVRGCFRGGMTVVGGVGDGGIKNGEEKQKRRRGG